MSFHFAESTPNEQLRRVFNAGLAKLDSETVTELYAQAISEVKGQARPSQMSAKQAAMCDALLQVLRGHMFHGSGPTEVTRDFEALGLGEEVAASLGKHYESKREELDRAAARNTVRVNQLVDLDWKFGVTASSKSMDKIGAAFLQLKLKMDRGGGEPEILNMELTLEQFYSFLSELEKAKQSLSVLG